MYPIAHGIDIVEIARLERLWQSHAERFLQRVYTPAEQAYCLDSRTPAIRLAGRFAVKEAVFKALGTGWRGGLEWTDVETLPDPLGKPLLSVTGGTARLAGTLGIAHFLVSISHAGGFATASVLGIGSENR